MKPTLKDCTTKKTSTNMSRMVSMIMLLIKKKVPLTSIKPVPKSSLGSLLIMFQSVIMSPFVISSPETRAKLMNMNWIKYSPNVKPRSMNFTGKSVHSHFSKILEVFFVKVLQVCFGPNNSIILPITTGPMVIQTPLSHQ
ncbi:conserved hypothetical protein [Candida tropicalis MYA-3404]|uniref:Uncharacterized protein n=1 Tax=Candida tropicalis (strain ATCC MYA-3404 / T1) TaxID=294747 RepID=C5M324_CANTT|nr:conserved hypothetical protein [Candida tropicalis MYA-3404]EER35723.1 conserved hypothetical protein [Candida tropicalis MYA-3404]KAG4409836.1 hypothetical protein JTP64_000474 [Candida tropicalis]